MASRSGTRSVCVFCGSGEVPCPEYARVATRLGELIGARGFRLVYGAGGAGLMGAVARGAVREGGEILGVVPEFLRQREIDEDLPEQDLVLTRDLLQRKHVMLQHSDAFVGLGGGYGTLDEIAEVLAMSALDVNARPLILVNTLGVWDGFLGVIDDLRDRGFLGDRALIHVVDSAEAAIQLVDGSNPASATASPRSREDAAEAASRPLALDDPG